MGVKWRFKKGHVSVPVDFFKNWLKLLEIT